MGTEQDSAAQDKLTLPELVLNSVERYGPKEAMVADGGLGERLTYSQLGERFTRLAGGLREQGIGENDVVALLADNRPDWGVCYLAIQTAGATVLPLDILLKPVEHLTLLREGRPRALIISAAFFHNLRESIERDFPEIQVIVMDDGASESGSTLLTIQKLLQSPPCLPWRPDASRTASLIFTSGTTGAPKAVILTHRNLVSNIYGVERKMKADYELRFLSVLPLSHVYECTAGFLHALSVGGTIVYARSLAGPSLIEDIRNNQITIMLGVPLLFEKMARGMRRKISQAPAVNRVLFTVFHGLSRASRKVGLSAGRTLFAGLRQKSGMASLRTMVCGGAPLDPQIAVFFTGLGFTFLEGYGMTECSPVISFNSERDNVIGSVGTAIEGLDVRIDKANEEGVGEIQVRGDSVTPGYLNDEEKTRQILKDGWLCTGDLGKLLDGRLYVCGRAKNLIVSAGGKNIYPEEIEAKLLESDLISEVLIVGRAKEGKHGEDVCALIFPDAEELFARLPDFDSENLTAEPAPSLIAEAVKEVNAGLADYKRIVRWEIVEREFEKTASRKIKRAHYS